MPTVRLPLLQGKISAEDILTVYAEHKRPMAVVTTGAKYHLVMLDSTRMLDAFRASERPHDKSGFNFVGMTLAPDDLGATQGAWIDVAVDSQLSVLLAAPQYACPKKDYSSSNPGTCPFHGDPLKRVKDGK
jgi:hypothetical protein